MFIPIQEWIEEIKNNRIENLIKLSNMYNDWYNAKKQKDSDNKKYVIINDITYNISNFDVSQKSKHQYQIDCGFSNITKTDMNIIISNRTEKDLRVVVEKETKDLLKFIETKVKSICDDVESILSIGSDLICVNGTNGKRVKIEKIYAGGYNIQCYHIRILVKEIKL